MTNRHIVDRALPERSKLRFYFPVPTEGGDKYVVELPFFENIQVKESKKARLNKYSLISRSSNLYSYMGADSRKLMVSFNISLPHLLEDHRDINLDKFVAYDQSVENIESEKQRFKEPNTTKPIPKGMAFRLGNDYTKRFATDSAKQVLMDSAIDRNLAIEEREKLKQKYGVGGTGGSLLSKGLSFIQPAFQAGVDAALDSIENAVFYKYRIIDLIIYWTNIVRASVVNYSKNPIYGPPIIRLNHGILYQDIPCICTSYSIDYNEAAGYDMDTLLPRQLRIQLRLEEIRTGDFGEFVGDGNAVEKDNLAGWEAVVTGETRSMDPGYQL